MKHPPAIIIVAASGTSKTLKPETVSYSAIVAKAVVFPAQGPPVRQIRVIWCFALEIAFE